MTDDGVFDDAGSHDDDSSVDDLFCAETDQGRWIIATGHLSAERFCSLAFDFARREWGAAQGGAWLAEFGGGEVMAASIWWGWLGLGDADDEGGMSATVLADEEDGACPITTLPY